MFINLPRLDSLLLSQCFERRMWPDAHPLWQYENVLKFDLIREADRAALSMQDLKAMTAVEIGERLKHPAAGPRLHEAAVWFPSLEIEVLPHPVTRTVLQLVVQIAPSFQWKTKLHGGALKWHIWVEDPQNENIYYAGPYLRCTSRMHFLCFCDKQTGLSFLNNNCRAMDASPG